MLRLVNFVVLLSCHSLNAQIQGVCRFRSVSIRIEQKLERGFWDMRCGERRNLHSKAKRVCNKGGGDVTATVYAE